MTWVFLLYLIYMSCVMYVQTESILKTCILLFGKDYKYSVSNHFHMYSLDKVQFIRVQ